MYLVENAQDNNSFVYLKSLFEILQKFIECLKTPGVSNRWKSMIEKPIDVNQ